MIDLDGSLINVHAGTLDSLAELERIEHSCFDTDRLSRRSFRHHLRSENSELLIAESDRGGCLGYGLVLYHQATRLARLYSLAVDPKARGMGVAKQLLESLENSAAGRGRLFMRLEVAKSNQQAISLYQACGYRVFGEYEDYYEDHSGALRLQKCIRKLMAEGVQRSVPWYQQKTDFTCGPASLIMAMASLNDEVLPCLPEELEIWREATTIFMTSGHGGCHPMGLALAAYRRGFVSEVWLNSSRPLFIDGVRSEHKKEVMRCVHEQFKEQCRQSHIDIHYQALTPDQMRHCLEKDKAILILISTYRLDGKKAPHWVVVTGIDDDCIYVHDPDVDDEMQTPMDCQYLPIAKEDVEKMSVFGSQRVRAAVVVG